ncbi:hypothetical protein [uncultured Williamsia sp.]|uniref:hypothetical protein n=1 Tax=uncultured Williamsia sp. TaxID=259311 RepID=UPI0026248524|nr:hypothetical protein [uncultured Williamsia sp.]
MGASTLRGLLEERSPLNLVVQGKVTAEEMAEIDRALALLADRKVKTSKSAFVRAATLSAARGLLEDAD